MRVGARTHIVGAFVAVGLVAPAVWMTLDRDAPFKRTGDIAQVAPSMCGLADDQHRCIKLNLQIEGLRSCRRAAAQNVRRWIIDAKGVRHEVGVFSSAYSGENDSNITHLFIVPITVAKGPATYGASACFACNPLQYVLDWPVCVDKPDILFDVN